MNLPGHNRADVGLGLAAVTGTVNIAAVGRETDIEPARSFFFFFAIRIFGDGDFGAEPELTRLLTRFATGLASALLAALLAALASTLA